MLDTRRHLIKTIHRNIQHPFQSNGTRFLLSLLFALGVAFIPEYSGMSGAAHDALFILLFAAALWISEAIPAFAVSLLIIALEIMILGYPGGEFAQAGHDWKMFLQPWSSPLVFLFFAGFIMAAAASKTKLDFWIAKKVIFYVGNRPEKIMTGIMAITFLLSMFISNTATAAMMLTVIYPILKSMDPANPFRKALLLSVAVSANIGGMGTIIGTPPNAIAVGTLQENAPSFFEWMMIALPVALVLVIILRQVLLWLYPSREATLNIDAIKNVKHYDDSTKNFSKVPENPSWKKWVVVFTFLATVMLWITGPLHGLPTTVVSMLPVVVFTVVGIIDVEEIRSLNWDILLLIIGGLSLGLAVSETGLALWFSQVFPLKHLSLLVLGLMFAYTITTFGNFMSNTAATNLMLPIIVAVTASMGQDASNSMVIAAALSASLAFCLPVSTPPNAIMFASGNLKSKDFLKIGLVASLIGPIIILGWQLLIH